MLPLPSFRSTGNTENSSDSNEFTLNKILVSSLRLNNRNLAEYANASFSVDHFNTLRANYTTQNPCANTSFTANHFANTNKTGTGISAFLDTSMVDFDTRNPETCVLTQLNFSLPLSWHNLSYRIGDRQVLYGLTGTALSGRCLAIMGSSGAGKTTFLNAISDRLPSNKDAKLSGSRKLGDIAYNQAFRKALGFVTQDDIISSMATPYEMLWFALRTRRGTNRRETHERVMGMLSTLKLIESKDTLIGVPGTSASLSGGERKRCSIGAELVCDPKVLLLDEPTSALDSVTSANIIQQLRELARLGSTIIYTIHQPTAEMLSAFDDIMLLTGGRCVYHGTMEDSLGYFESIGFKCPDHYTAGDYFMKLLQDESTARVLIQEWEKYLKSGKRTPHTTSIRPVMRRRNSVALKFIDMYVKKYKSSMFIQFTEVFFRRLNELRRDRAFILALLVQTLYFSFVAGLIFMHLGMDEASIQDRQGLLYTILANRIMGSIYSSLASFHRVHIIFLHDQHSDAYSPFFYFFGTMCAQLPFMFSLSLIESIIVYFLTGLYTSASAFFIYFCIMFVFHGVCVNIGILLSASFESLTLATSMVALINLPFTFASGLFASTDRLRPYFYLFEKLSYIRYAYILLLRNELKHINHIDCDAQRYGELFCRNQPQNGKDVLVQLGFDADPQSTDLIMWLSLILMWILLQISTIVVLMVMSRRKR